MPCTICGFLWFGFRRRIGHRPDQRIAGDLAGLRERIPYLTELGITYLHLMPVFRVPDGDNDGGYSVMDYRAVNPAYIPRNHRIEQAIEQGYAGDFALFNRLLERWQKAFEFDAAVRCDRTGGRR